MKHLIFDIIEFLQSQSIVKFKFIFMIFLVLIFGKIPYLHYIEFPFVQLSTYFHEIGHCFVSSIFGGFISGITLYVGGGGVCYSSEPIFFAKFAEFLLLFFGHGGEVTFGFLIFLVANYHWIDLRKFSYGIAIFIFVTLFFVRELQSAGVIGACALIFLLINRIKNENHVRMVLKLIGIYLVVMVIFKVGIYYDFITMIADGNKVASDALQLAKLTKTNEVLWIKAWSIFSIGTVVVMYLIDKDTIYGDEISSEY